MLLQDVDENITKKEVTTTFNTALEKSVEAKVLNLIVKDAEALLSLRYQW